MAEYKAGPLKRRPTHPGRILASALEESGTTANAASSVIGVSRMALGNIINEKAAVTPEMALRLGTYFDNGAEVWLSLQAAYDLWNAREKLAPELARIKAAREG